MLWLSPIEPPSRVVNHLRSRGLRLCLQEETPTLPPARLAPLPLDAAVLRKLTLNGRRVAVLHPDPGNADAQAQSLRSRGAEVIALGLDPALLDRVETFDADAVLIEAVDFYAGCWEIVRALWRHPRMRWAPVILATPDPLALANLTSPNVNLVCAAVQSLSLDSDEIVARVRSRETFEIALERIGPARTLRALLEPGFSLRARFEADAVTVEVDVAERIIVGARGGHGLNVDDSLLGPEALAALMSGARGRVMIQPVASPAVTNLMAPLDTALHAARESLRAPARVPSASPLSSSATSSSRTTVVSFARPPKEVLVERVMSPSAAQAAQVAKPLVVPPPPVALVKQPHGRSQDEKPAQRARPDARRDGKTRTASPQFTRKQGVVLMEEDAHSKGEIAGDNIAETHERTPSPAEEARALVFAHARTLVGLSPVASPLAHNVPPGNSKPGGDAPQNAPTHQFVSATATSKDEPVAWKDEQDTTHADELDDIEASTLATTLASGVAWPKPRRGILAFTAVPIFCAATLWLWPTTPPANNVTVAPTKPLTAATLGTDAPAPAHASHEAAPERRALANVPMVGEPSVDSGRANDDNDSLERRERARQASKLVGQGHSFRRKGLLGAARARYLQALDAFDGYPRALAGLTQVALAQKDGPEALRYARGLVRARPNEANHHLLLGDAYALSGNNDKAREEWRVASGLGSRTARTRLK